MDKLEQVCCCACHSPCGWLTVIVQTKAEYENEDAITDDTAGQAYVEQFAQETLDRAERVVKANKVTQYVHHLFPMASRSNTP